ncbi:F-box/WD repeat-containing protein 8-like [Tubulanus polymorphus]|uniref:F-box/WD repeat-containing protein 8-like n=1 Tax=Tubulanus polymorphus TaxID=672921 RepID=UPI003DA463E1
MDENELDRFRKAWKNEIQKCTKDKPDGSTPTSSSVSEYDRKDLSLLDRDKSMNEQFPSIGIANGLLEKWILDPQESQNGVLACISTGKRKIDQIERSQPPLKRKPESELLDQLLADLDEINEIPFFDLTVPREVAIHIFKHLSMFDLCQCAKVSAAWRHIAEDEWLWWKICVELGFETKHVTADKMNWKSLVREAVTSRNSLFHNWKNRIGKISCLEHYQGGILCAVDSFKRTVVAAYTSGDVKQWNIDSGDACTFKASNTSLVVDERVDQGTLNNFSTSVAIGNHHIIAGYEQGYVDIWKMDISSPIITYSGDHSIKHVSAAKSESIFASCWDRHVRVDYIDDTTLRNTYHSNLGEVVKQVKLVQRSSTSVFRSHCAIISTTSKVHLLIPGQDSSVLHELAASMLTCMDCSTSEMACGVTSYGLLNGCKMYVYCVSTGRLITTLRGHGSSCISVVDISRAPPHMIVTGSVDKTCCVHDLRCVKTVMQLRGHSRAISSVQMDDWKVVSGAEDGIVCIHDQRMSSKLWEYHNSHPVRYLNFDKEVLLSGHVPTSKEPLVDEQDCVMHKRYRGVIQMYDFSASRETLGIPSICMSKYDEPQGYNYNIKLTVPYD